MDPSPSATAACPSTLKDDEVWLLFPLTKDHAALCPETKTYRDLLNDNTVVRSATLLSRWREVFVCTPSIEVPSTPGVLRIGYWSAGQTFGLITVRGARMVTIRVLAPPWVLPSPTRWPAGPYPLFFLTDAEKIMPPPEQLFMGQKVLDTIYISSGRYTLSHFSLLGFPRGPQPFLKIRLLFLRGWGRVRHAVFGPETR